MNATVADVAAVLNNAVIGKFGAALGGCPLCHKPKSTQIFEHAGMLVVDRLCPCDRKKVRAEVIARYAEQRGAELELFTLAEARSKAKANGANGHAKPRSDPQSVKDEGRNIAAVMDILRNDPVWRDVLAYDRFSLHVMLMKP